MTAIEAVSDYVPAHRVPVGVCLRRYDIDESRVRLYEHFFGFSEVRIDSSATLTDLLVAAMSRLELAAVGPHVRYVMHARSMPVVAPYPVNPLRQACDAVGLGHALTFSLTHHACASALLAIDLAGKLLAAEDDPRARALVLTGDKAFTASARVIADTGVMGEASAAVLVRLGGGHDRVLGYATHTLGRYYEGPWMSAERSTEFKEQYAEALASVILAATECAGMAMDDIRLILPHNVNRMSWLRVLRLLGIGSDRLFLDNLPKFGHCFGSDSFINLRSARTQGRLNRGDRYLMTAVGLGATFSAMVFEH
ncbi:3-oxoacyl-[acyl-carrier-protein] synthase III C-terminal domain-containing protein [Nonomuraea insulae]|uniref:3-oxoacyl-[acyl-carrier-protein] synthase III C-terminal domain-containing protein n=1 Tax=Nonomuraea insulae TaxID=1616787 RepID=A0ABW1D809_9ACTN